jgi:hypothetical protein
MTIGKFERDEDQFLAHPKLQKAIRRIATEDAHRRPRKIGDEIILFVCIQANHGDNERLQGFLDQP